LGGHGFKGCARIEANAHPNCLVCQSPSG